MFPASKLCSYWTKKNRTCTSRGSWMPSADRKDMFRVRKRHRFFASDRDLCNEIFKRQKKSKDMLPQLKLHIYNQQLTKDVSLRGGHQRMRDGVDRKSNTVLDAAFAHQFRHVGLDCALFDAHHRADFFVGAAHDQ